jgi:uroporphyrinogen decarboxylase
MLPVMFLSVLGFYHRTDSRSIEDGCVKISEAMAGRATMTGRERIEALLAGQRADRAPFAPAVYEHKAALVGTTPSRLARDPVLLERALLREAEIYRADLLVVGCDVYNVEAEAAGCEVRFSETNDVPSIVGRVLEPGSDLSRLRIPDPERDGRMPVFLEAGRRVAGTLGREVVVRGALSAPFSLAAELVGAEPLLLALIDDPLWTVRLLDRAAAIVKAYGRAFRDRGLGVILFDSHAAPPLVSPRLYEEIILPSTASVISYFRRDLRLPLVPYIMGGDTGRLLDLILATGSNNILCDFRADLAAFAAKLSGKPVLLRANLDPRFLLTATAEEIRARTREVLSVGRRHPGFLLGTGILPYDLPPEKVIAVRDALDEK